MPKSARVLIDGALTLERLLAFVEAPDYPPLRLAGALMLAWRWVEGESWESTSAARLFSESFRKADLDFDVTCDRLELLRLAFARCARETEAGREWLFPFDSAALAGRLLNEPAWLAPVLPSKRPAARQYLLALLGRIPGTDPAAHR
jgi:hypothetical protein